ncbi:SNF2 family N-terminal domain-containing protein [Hyaloscypha finlandica]|nr:SNF2 family N-terminal domain-containing protein [Hyaloscypha finlandica]
MSARADDTHAAKRRRLSVVNDIQSRATPPRSYLSPNGFDTPILGPERWNNVGTKPTDGEEVVASPSTSAGHDRLSQVDQEPLECCYGMLCDIPANIGSEANPNSNHIPVEFQSPKYLPSKLDGGLNTFHIGCPKAIRILCELENVAEVTTQLYCHSELEGSLGGGVRHNGRHRGKPLKSWFLNIILFGRVNLEEKLGKYLSNHKMYLQDPRGCERCVPYRNPHIIQSDSGETVMTSSFVSTLGNLQIERLEAGPNLLTQLMVGVVILPETEAPDIVKTKLFKHQKQALTFMLRREKGWALEDGARDVWSRQRDPVGRFSYINNVSGYSTGEAPLDFRGGLLADDMGLGKTLSMISLIAANQANLPVALNYMSSGVVKTTLLIVPPTLIQTWVKQLRLHLRSESIHYHVYHGQNRTDTESLERYDVVVTTYHTVSAIWRKLKDQRSNDKSIFSTTWHRIILDEAHTIQNPQSHLAQACCTLRSTRRWAITGTPIQNKLADFASIVKFLRVYPYSDLKTFEEEILKPWQNRQSTDAQGFLRLKTLVRAITISRTKAVVDLPLRVDEIHHLDFSPAEREKYDAATIQSRLLLEEAISSGNQSGKTFNALWLLNILRLICNHGLLAQSTMESKLPRTPRSQGRSPCEVSDSVYGNILGGSANCLNCGANLLDDLLEGSAKADFEPHRQTRPCDQLICERCRSQNEDDRAGYFQWDPSIESRENSAPATPSVDLDLALTISNMSTKIKALIANLDKHSTTEKSVVFSYWTNTLDLVQLMLDDRGIPHSRIDGKTSLPKRNEALQAFQSDDSVRVILVSITCGGAGLDLTAGSRVYLIEPHWNPMIEEQALCRVHRVGQTRNVTTIRYLMRDSFEEQIVNIQKRKKMLAQVTFAEGPLSENGISLGTLQYLKSVL